MKKYIFSLLTAFVAAACLTACSDMLDKGNENVLYGDKNHLVNAGDTVNSYTGILYQLQKIAVRTNLLGELRGDMVDVRDNANANIKDIANFACTDDNIYNDPRDYYAIINNCNYYLAHADDSLKNNQNRYIFKHEKDAVRCIRAWIYLQLGQIYGANIPLVTEPILSELDASLDKHPKVDLQGICDYFINDLSRFPLQINDPNYSYPRHNTYDKNTADPYLCVVPLDLIRGDLYLWRASITGSQDDARQAALAYYSFIYWNQGFKPYTRIRENIRNQWSDQDVRQGNMRRPNTAYNSAFNNTSRGGECLSVIPMDSASADGEYNLLRKLYASSYDDTSGELIECSFEPSKPCWDYSDSQIYCAYVNSEIYYVQPSSFTDEDLEQHLVGDLRMLSNFEEQNRVINLKNTVVSSIRKIDQFNVTLYRAGQVYLRMAEALNMAGFPKFALAILTTGIDDIIIRHDVLSQCNNSADSAYIQQFSLPVELFRASINYDAYGNRVAYTQGNQVYNIGLHSRGCGDTPYNDQYYPYAADAPKDSTGYPVYPDTSLVQFMDVSGETYPVREDYNTNREFNQAVDTFNAHYFNWYTLTLDLYRDDCDVWYATYGAPQVKPYQVLALDSLIDVEQALETCFEGFRFGDLLRASYRAERRGQTGYFAEKVARRDPSLAGLLANRNRWFLNWKNQIGYAR